MANLLAQIEDALLARLQIAIPSGIKAYATAPADWSEAIADQFLRDAPALLVAFAGYKKIDGYYQGPKIARFLVFALTAGSIEDKRRRGDALAPGAYDLAIQADEALDGLTLNDALANPIGTLDVTGCDNLFTTQLWDMGGTCYGLAVEIKIEFDALTTVDQPSGILQQVNTDWDVATFATQADYDRWLQDNLAAPGPDAQDQTVLPGG